MAATVVSMLNMKGGVGKTTLSYNMAWFAAEKKCLNVLAIDADPQSNLTQYFMGEYGYRNFVDKEGNLTICDIFEKNHWGSEIIYNIKSTYYYNLDLIPSCIDLVTTLKNPTQKDRKLSRFLAGVKDNYDLILIDCPPTDSILTAACYLASEYVVIPVRPERLATIGLPLLARSITDFNLENQGDHQINVAGIMFNDVRTNEPQESYSSKRDVERFAKISGWEVFEGEIRTSDSYARGSREGRPIFKTDYARSEVIDEFYALGNEFMERVGLV